MASEDPTEEEESEQFVEHVAVETVTEAPPRSTFVATITNDGIQPSTFMTRWRGAQWLVALLALLAPLALMFGIVYVFRDEFRRAAEAVGF